MPATTPPPSTTELATALGSAQAVWTGLVETLSERYTPLDDQWRPSKNAFGRTCRLQHKKRTLIYLMPGKKEFMVAIILGERAYNLLQASTIPAKIKKLFAEARPYVEGRGIRLTVNKASDIPLIAKLVEIKTTPK